MIIDATNNRVFDFLTEPRFRIRRKMLCMLMLTGCSSGQVFLMFREQIESLGYVVCIIGVALTLLYALLLHLNINYLAPHFLFHNKYAEYFTLLLAITVIVWLCVKFFTSYPIFYPYKALLPFNAVSLLDTLSSLLITAICMTSSLIPTLVRQWLTDTRKIGNLENRRLKSTIDEFKNHISTGLLYDIIENTSEQVKTAPDKASAMIISLSELLRYELYDGKREKVILQSDIQFIRNYLSLVHQVCTSFVYSVSVTGNTNLFIPPLQFLPFIQKIVKQQPEKLDIYYAIGSVAIELRCKVSRGNSCETKYMRLELKKC